MLVEEVVWDAEEHTRAKHKILKGYLDAWAPIMSQQAAKYSSRSPLYIDAFAGPGIYKDGADGSPLVAIKGVLEHDRHFPLPIRMSFIELNPDRFGILESRLGAIRDRGRPRVEIEQILNTSCQDGLRNLIATEKNRFGSFGPALVFLDQFGYSQAPMDLIGEVLAGESCEALIYLDYRRMNHTLSDPNKEAALTRAFGSDSWKGAIDLQGSSRVPFLRDRYKEGLSRFGAEFVWDFQLRGRNNELLSWLFFCSRSRRGLEEMKKAMYRLDLTGNFRFSDRDVDQLNLLSEVFDQAWLEGHLEAEFAGRTKTLGVVQKYVLTETPLITFKTALGNLEAKEKLEVVDAPPGRKKRSFKLDESTQLKFSTGQQEQGRLF